jgi:HlyD family secretion protein
LRPVLRLAFTAIALIGLNACGNSASPGGRKARADTAPAGNVTIVRRGSFRHILRLSGTVGAVETYGVQAPRLTGQMSSTMVITRIVSSGTHVRAGDILVEMDRQNQLKNIQDKQAEYDNLVQQIRKKQADQAAARAADETELKGAEVDVQTARVEMRKNEVIPAYQAEINKVDLAEAEAKLEQLKETFALKREAQAAELRILEIQRDRARLAVDYAQSNVENMTIKSPMDGLAVLTPSYRGTRMVDLQEGDEVRSGSGIMVVVNPASMQVVARVNQVDISKVHVGRRAEIRLDAYPDLTFPGKVESISAIGTSSTYLKRIRYFTIVVSIQGSNPKLLPDLTASVDLQLENAKDALILPRESVVMRDGGAMVELLENGESRIQPIKIGLMNDCEVTVESGIKEGAVVSLHPRIPVGADKQLPGPDGDPSSEADSEVVDRAVLAGWQNES